MICKSCGSDNCEFYASNKNKCKECIKAGVRANRLKNITYYREFDRQRANDPSRINARNEYKQTEAYKIAHLKANQKYRLNESIKKSAHGALATAVCKGVISKEPCIICGDFNSHGHHFDYRLPLNVIWLCDEHHKHAHKIANEIARQMEILSENDSSDVISSIKQNQKPTKNISYAPF